MSFVAFFYKLIRTHKDVFVGFYAKAALMIMTVMFLVEI